MPRAAVWSWSRGGVTTLYRWRPPETGAGHGATASVGILFVPRRFSLLEPLQAGVGWGGGRIACMGREGGATVVLEQLPRWGTLKSSRQPRCVCDCMCVFSWTRMCLCEWTQNVVSCHPIMLLFIVKNDVSR